MKLCSQRMQKDLASAEIDSNKSELEELSSTIHSNPELAWKEHKAHELGAFLHGH